MKVEEPPLALDAVERRVPPDCPAHVGDGVPDERIEAAPDVAFPARHRSDVRLHGGVAVALGDLRVPAGEEGRLRSGPSVFGLRLLLRRVAGHRGLLLVCLGGVRGRDPDRGNQLRLRGLHAAERLPVPVVPALQLHRGDREAEAGRGVHLHAGHEERVVRLVHVRDGVHQPLARQVLAGRLQRVDEREGLGHPGDQEPVGRVGARNVLLDDLRGERGARILLELRRGGILAPEDGDRAVRRRLRVELHDRGRRRDIVDVDLRLPAELVRVDECLDRELAERKDGERVRAARLQLRDLGLHVGCRGVVADGLHDHRARLRTEPLAETGEHVLAVVVALVEDGDLRLLPVGGQDVLRVEPTLEGVRRQVADRPRVLRVVTAEGRRTRRGENGRHAGRVRVVADRQVPVRADDGEQREDVVLLDQLPHVVDRPGRVVAVVEVFEVDLAAVHAAARVDVLEVPLRTLEDARRRSCLAGEWAARADRDRRGRDTRRSDERRRGDPCERERGGSEGEQGADHRAPMEPRFERRDAVRRSIGSTIISTTSTSPKKNVVGPACFVSTCGNTPTTSGRNWIRSAPKTAPQIDPKNPTTAPTSRYSESWIGKVSGDTYATLIANNAPPTPANAADTPKASTLYSARLTPEAAAASSLSRTARSERPKRASSSHHASRNRTPPIVHVSAYSHWLFVSPHTPTPCPVWVGLPNNVIPVDPPVRWSNFFRIVGRTTAMPKVARAR